MHTCIDGVLQAHHDCTTQALAERMQHAVCLTSLDKSLSLASMSRPCKLPCLMASSSAAAFGPLGRCLTRDRWCSGRTFGDIDCIRRLPTLRPHPGLNPPWLLLRSALRTRVLGLTSGACARLRLRIRVSGIGHRPLSARAYDKLAPWGAAATAGICRGN